MRQRDRDVLLFGFLWLIYANVKGTQAAVRGAVDRLDPDLLSPEGLKKKGVDILIDKLIDRVTGG